MNFMWENIFKRESAENDVKTFLSKNYIFADLTKKELRFVENLVHKRHYQPGEYIFKQGEVGVGMYMILKGNVDVTLASPDLSPNDQALYVTTLEPGDFFGEIALIEENGHRTANAIARDSVTVLGFFQPDLQELVERNPTTGIKIISKLAKVLGKRLKETSDKITDLKREMNR